MKHHDAGDVSHEDDLVELTRVPFPAEAFAIGQDLERIGIPATVFESDAGGWAPHFAIGEGHRVMVHARNLAAAQQVLSDVGGQLACDPSPEPPSHEVHKHLRPHTP